MKVEMKTGLAIAVLVGVSSLLACGKSEKASEADAASPVASASAASTIDAGGPDTGSSMTGALPSHEGAIATIPSPDKAEHKAARQITKTNYKTELDSLEKEIGK